MKVKLNKPHEHAGEQYEAGEQIEVTQGQANWLADQGIIDKPKSSNVTPLGGDQKE